MLCVEQHSTLNLKGKENLATLHAANNYAIQPALVQLPAFLQRCVINDCEFFLRYTTDQTAGHLRTEK